AGSAAAASSRDGSPDAAVPAGPVADGPVPDGAAPDGPPVRSPSAFSSARPTDAGAAVSVPVERSDLPPVSVNAAPISVVSEIAVSADSAPGPGSKRPFATARTSGGRGAGSAGAASNGSWGYGGTAVSEAMSSSVGAPSLSLIASSHASGSSSACGS